MYYCEILLDIHKNTKMTEEEFTNVLFRSSATKDFSIYKPQLSGNHIVFHKVVKVSMCL